jgi:hypothetical protein
MSPLEATIQQVEAKPVSAAEATRALPGELLTGGGYKSINTALRSIFPTAQEETKLQKARAILGEVGKTASDAELELFLTKLQCLIDSWLDVYEREAFEGQTLRDILVGG